VRPEPHNSNVTRNETRILKKRLFQNLVIKSLSVGDDHRGAFCPDSAKLVGGVARTLAESEDLLVG
jgi:hypothetical protein